MTGLYEELPLMPLPKKPDSASTTVSTKSEDMKASYEKKEDSSHESKLILLMFSLSFKNQILFSFQGISECKVEVTYIVTPSLFFVRKVASKSKFKQLEKELTKYGEDRQNAEPPIKLKRGKSVSARGLIARHLTCLLFFHRWFYCSDNTCIVKQRKYEKWFRARVNAVNTIDDGETLYNVFYLDYGFEECNIPTSRIRNIAQHLLELPPQAIRCCLHGLIPKKLHWTNASTNDFMKLTNGADCSMFIIKSTPDILYVDLCVISKDNNMGPQSMCNTMKIMDYARLDNWQNTTQISANTCVYNKEELPNNTSIQVSVSWVESPDKIYVNKIGRQAKFLKLKETLQEYYRQDNLTKMIDSPQVGLPCAVQLEDFTWQRGEIIEILSEKEVRVFLVDCGCTLVSNYNQLRAISHEYTMLNAQVN